MFRTEAARGSTRAAGRFRTTDKAIDSMGVAAQDEAAEPVEFMQLSRFGFSEDLAEEWNEGVFGSFGDIPSGFVRPTPDPIAPPRLPAACRQRENLV